MALILLPALKSAGFSRRRFRLATPPDTANSALAIEVAHCVSAQLANYTHSSRLLPSYPSQ